MVLLRRNEQRNNDNGSNEHDGAYWYRDIHWNDGIKCNSSN